MSVYQCLTSHRSNPILQRVRQSDSISAVVQTAHAPMRRGATCGQRWRDAEVRRVRRNRADTEVIPANAFLFSQDARGDNFVRAAISRSPPPCPRPRQAARRSHRDRHTVNLRCASAVRFARKFPAAHDKKAAPQINHLRTALVFARRYECSLS